MRISLVYAPAPRSVQELVMEVPDACTLQQALQLSGWLQRFPEIGSEGLQLGIWNHRAAAETMLREGDRVEIYRPLRVDPKVARRERFVGQGARSTGLFSRRRPGGKAGY